jgi:hypothetical protein
MGLLSVMRQPTLFEKKGSGSTASAEQVVLYALGDFQSRGKVLAQRELPLDRLRGALRRASEAFGVEELDDERAVAAFYALGAQVRRVPPFVAKHPFYITVPTELATRARDVYQDKLKVQSSKSVAEP